MITVSGRICQVFLLSMFCLCSSLAQTELLDHTDLEENNDLASIETQAASYNSQKSVKLNSAQLEELLSSGLFTISQSDAIMNHRKKYGSFLCLEELQQLKCFTKAELRSLSDFVIIEAGLGELNFTHSRSNISIRHHRLIENSQAYSQKTYAGSPDYLLIRYRVNKTGFYDIGFHLEKDSGEKLIYQKGVLPRFDHQRFYLNFYKSHGPIRQIVLGDFRINMGQGLISNARFNIGNNFNPSGLIRRGQSIYKFSGLDENRFHRGVAAKMKLSKSIHITSYLSHKKYDALLIEDESTDQDSISSLQLSGYHRTDTELTRKKNVSVLSYGSIIDIKVKNTQIGLNQQSYKFNHPFLIHKSAFRPQGLRQNTSLFSLDIRTDWNSILFFGEWAFNDQLKHALVFGLITSLDPRFDIGLSYRDYSPSYSSFFSGAIGQSSSAQNERGLRLALTYALNKQWSIQYSFDTWLKLKSKNAFIGSKLSSENLLRITYSDKNFLKVYLLFSSRQFPKSVEDVLLKAILHKRHSLRLHCSYLPLKGIELRSRLEFSRYSYTAHAEKGILTYYEIVYKITQHKIRARFRMTLFETTSHESRIYAYEQTVPGYYAIPSYSGSGYKVQLIIGLKPLNNLNIDLGYTRISYYDRNEIGSGMDKIMGSEKSQLQTQMVYSF